jgi:hypothetical protein
MAWLGVETWSPGKGWTKGGASFDELFLGRPVSRVLAARLGMPALKFAVSDGEPEVWTPGEAWAFRNGSWERINSAVVGMDAAVVSKATFDAKFPALPSLPSNAFNRPHPPRIPRRRSTGIRWRRWSGWKRRGLLHHRSCLNCR